MAMIDAEGGVEGVVKVGVRGDGITIGCGRPGVVLREIGMIVLGPGADWFPLVSLVASVLSLRSLARLTLLTTPALSVSMASLMMEKDSLSTRSASSVLEPDSEGLGSSMGERGA